ncbi:type II toxin-antitoxin system RelE/ParE family toxin [Devosia sp. A369]
MTTPDEEIEVYRTDVFNAWLGGLRDHKAVAKITTRIDRLQLGNPGDAEPVGEGVSEMRIHYGPGYRVYFMQQGSVVVILLCGGAKSSQKGDIKLAKALASEIKDASHG